MDWYTTSTILYGLRDFENKSAWNRFVSRFQAPLSRFVQRTGVRSDDVDDVVQESLLAFADAFSSGKYERDRGRLSSWLFGITYRQSLRQLKRYGMREVRPVTQTGRTSFLERIEDERSARTLWDRIWDEHMVEQCLERARAEVSGEAYRVFELVILHERSPDEAADELRIDKRAVYNHKHRVLKRLREIREELEHVS